MSHKFDPIFSCLYSQRLCHAEDVPHLHCAVQSRCCRLAHRPQWKRIKVCLLHGFRWVGDYKSTNRLVSCANAHLPLQSLSSVHLPWAMRRDFTMYILYYYNVLEKSLSLLKKKHSVRCSYVILIVSGITLGDKIIPSRWLHPVS